MDRIEMVQEHVDDILQSTVNEIERKCGYKHLYGVSQACAILAMKRNENVELAMIAGLLHDIYTYKMLDSTDHAIYNHSDKTNKDTLFDEILKDADVLQHCLYNPIAHVAEHEKDRFRMLKEELGICKVEH